jgi:Flp pilus assembly protein TadB
MSIVAAVVAGAAVFLLVTRSGAPSLAERIGVYIIEPRPDDPHDGVRSVRDMSFVLWVVSGGLIGVLLAQGDLFISGTGRSLPALSVLGAVGGWFTWSARRSTQRERRALRLRHELPLIADALALHSLAGESVSFALAAVVRETDGVASDEFASVLRAHAAGEGFVEALTEGKRDTAHPQGERLYEALIHAHTSGGRLADTLNALASDFRSSIATDLTSEAGRRAVTSYGPVLALMVPTALLFLLYPTLLGLRALSGAP